MKQFNVMLTMLSLMISVSIFGQEKTAIKNVEVTASELTARAGASKDHRSLGKFKRDEVLPVYSVSGEWYETKCPADLKVYIFQKYITVTGNNGVIIGENVNGRADSSEEGQILFKFPAKTKVDVLGLSGGWVKIAPPPSATAWIAKQYTKDSANSVVEVVEGDKKASKTKEHNHKEDIGENEGGKEEPVKVKTADKNKKGAKQSGVDPKVEALIAEGNKKKELIKQDAEEKQKKILAGETEDKFLKTGWVRRLGKVVGRKATHALYLSEGTDICHLISNDPNIKLEDFANKYVGIKGEENGKEKRSDVPLISVTSIVVLENNPNKIRLKEPSKVEEKPAKEEIKEVMEDK